jgi:hypothetical protein
MRVGAAAHLFHQIPQAILAPRRDAHRRALAGEVESRPSSDAARGSRDYTNLSAHFHFSPPIMVGISRSRAGFTWGDAGY